MQHSEKLGEFISIRGIVIDRWGVKVGVESGWDSCII